MFQNSTLIFLHINLKENHLEGVIILWSFRNYYNLQNHFSNTAFKRFFFYGLRKNLN